MIVYRDYAVNAKEITALISFRQEVEGKMMLSLYKNKEIADENIQGAVEKVLQEKRLLNNERFMETGYYLESFNDIVSLELLECGEAVFVANIKSVDLRVNNHHRDGYVKCDEKYKEVLTNYERYNERNLNLKISQVHDLAFEKSKGKRTVDLKIEGDQFSIESEENWPLSENTIASPIKAELMTKIEDALDEHIVYEDHRFMLRSNANFFLEYLKNNNKYNKTHQQLTIQDETLYIDSTKFALAVFVQYGIQLMQEKIIPIDRLKNEIRRLIDMDEFKAIRTNISVDKVIADLKLEIKNYPIARKHHMIAEDLLRGKNDVFQKPFANLTEKTCGMHDYLQKILSMNSKPKHIYIVSKFFTSFNKQQPLEEMNVGDYKKKIVYDTVRTMIKEGKVKGTILSEARSFKDKVFSHQQISMKLFHDRYLIIKKDKDYEYYCLTAELDNFDWVDQQNQTIRLRDTKIMRLKNRNQLPKTILGALEVEK